MIELKYYFYNISQHFSTYIVAQKLHMLLNKSSKMFFM